MIVSEREEFWKSKITALLHDPLVKAFDVKNHEDIAGEILKTLGIEKSRGEEDRLASAMDRFPIPYEKDAKKQIHVSFDETLFVHPFSGEELPEVKSFFQNQKVEEMKSRLINALTKLKERNNTYEKLFHSIWWNLPYILEGSQFLPADTRIANHSIIDHLDVTSALKGCVEGKQVKASLIAVAIGPVQEVIAQARKVKDLWAGSYLLSYLIYGAIEVVGKKYGFDSIISPYLRGNYFVKETLETMGVDLEDLCPVLPRREVASLPNLFVAIVPSSDEEILKECEEAIKNRWETIVDKTKEKLSKSEFLFNERSFDYQASLFPDIQTSKVSFDEPEKIVETVRNLFTGSGIEDFKEVLRKVSEHAGYKENPGTFYRYLHRLLTSKLAARKMARLFPGYEEDVYSPHFTSEKEFLDFLKEKEEELFHDADDFGAGVRACAVCRDIEKKDRLGTLNTVKRFLPEILNIRIKFDSTTDIARNNQANKEIEDPAKFKNGYIAVLLMDGDRMGDWMLGENAPSLEKVINPKVIEMFQETDDLKYAWEKLKEFKTIQPAYHRGVSRTLGIFSQFVGKIVDRHNGMLVYSGGDDVLALLPADSVLECANDIRKFFSGYLEYEIEIENGSDVERFRSENGVLYHNDKPFAPLMGKVATMSAGIAIVHHKFPLQVALNMAREAEKKAKRVYGRNAFCVAQVKRSGQIVFAGSRWEIEGEDVVRRSLKILEEMKNYNVSHRSLYKLLSPDFSLYEDKMEKFVEFTLRRSIHSEKSKNEFIGNFKDFLGRMVDYYKNTKRASFDEAMREALEFLIMVYSMKRGESQ
ncbi:MAG TPA: type III-B CRISPR-associated protein Cas10/Cmr2 [Thermotoga sp.]|jgi:CRISPR-associated protein Cmr2|uniref:type III-B CRISPR-associated protein Cas10/Cmr2 n=1 Tax=Thermotoga sp. (strain RQ2) TaxID=126740 RepID=UPI000321EB11|nr:type III-B CRISPR-associated protein Cas10/Cmr2 [Thermotoga sp. RQ2]HBF69997.1 type III-B CRISPR-associated protein Cas10/Cmr2 [Thermotoga sp.]